MKIKIILMGVLLLSYFIISCALTTKPPLPASLNIVKPSPEIPPDLAAFVGIWKGKWANVQDTIIVVEQVDSKKARILLSYGSLVHGIGFKPPDYYRYITADVLSGPILEFTEDVEPTPIDKGDYYCPCKGTFEIDKSSNVLTVYWEYTKQHMKLRADLTKQ